MPIATGLVYDICCITDVKRNDHDAEITFRDGSTAYPESSQPNAQRLLWLAEWMPSRRGVRVVLDSNGQIIDILPATGQRGAARSAFAVWEGSGQNVTSAFSPDTLSLAGHGHHATSRLQCLGTPVAERRRGQKLSRVK